MYFLKHLVESLADLATDHIVAYRLKYKQFILNSQSMCLEATEAHGLMPLTWNQIPKLNSGSNYKQSVGS